MTEVSSVLESALMIGWYFISIPKIRYNFSLLSTTFEAEMLWPTVTRASRLSSEMSENSKLTQKIFYNIAWSITKNVRYGINFVIHHNPSDYSLHFPLEMFIHKQCNVAINVHTRFFVGCDSGQQYFLFCVSRANVVCRKSLSYHIAWQEKLEENVLHARRFDMLERLFINQPRCVGIKLIVLHHRPHLVSPQ